MPDLIASLTAGDIAALSTTMDAVWERTSAWGAPDIGSSSPAGEEDTG